MSNGLCPSCGATVNIPEGANEVQCEYCKTLVKEEEATREFEKFKKTPYGDLLLIADTALEGRSFSDAYNFYNKIIETSPTFADAWLKKGIAMVKMSSGSTPKIMEAIGSWKIAVKCAKNPTPMKKRVAIEINNVVTDFYPVLQNHFLRTLGDTFFKFTGREALSNSLLTMVDDLVSEHLNNFVALESAIDYALQLDQNPKIIRNAMAICDNVASSTADGIIKNTRIEADRGFKQIRDSYSNKYAQISNDENRFHSEVLNSDSGYRLGSTGIGDGLLGSFVGTIFDYDRDPYEEDRKKRERERKRRERERLRNEEQRIAREKSIIDSCVSAESTSFGLKQMSFHEIKYKFNEKILKIKSKYEELLLKVDPEYALEVKRKKDEELRRIKEEELKRKKEEELRALREKEEQKKKEEEERKKYEQWKKNSCAKFGCLGCLIPLIISLFFMSAIDEGMDDYSQSVVFLLFTVLCIMGYVIGHRERKKYLKSR